MNIFSTNELIGAVIAVGYFFLLWYWLPVLSKPKKSRLAFAAGAFGLTVLAIHILIAISLGPDWYRPSQFEQLPQFVQANKFIPTYIGLLIALPAAFNYISAIMRR